MSETNIAQEISRIISARNIIRNKVVNIFGNNYTTANLTTLASVIDNITNQGAISAQVQEGAIYTIPAGYHNGSGVVAGITGGGSDPELQTKTVTPTKQQQTVSPDEGKYLSSVTVEPIPLAYQDVSTVDASSGDVLANKRIVDSAGSNVIGTMLNNGAVSEIVSVATPTYTVPTGYHNGQGTVSIVTETKNITPSTDTQTISATTGKVISSITVEPIPSEYQDISNVTATASDVLAGVTFVNSSGSEVEGTMVNRGTVSQTLSTSTTSYTIPAGKHSGSGSVSITLEEKTVSPTESIQNITPSSGKVLSKVTVNAIDSSYVGSNIATRSAADLTASGSVVSAPAGYYATGVSKAVGAGSATTPAKTITVTPTISVSDSGVISVTVSDSSYITPTISAGYISTGISGKVSVTGDNTMTLTTQDETIYNTSITDQTIASGIYLTGVQTIKAVQTTNISAINIKDGVTVKVGDANDNDRIIGITGTFTDASTVSSGQTAATADQLLDGYSAWVDGAEVKGSITNRNAVSATIDGLTQTSYTIQAGYHNGSGTVSLTSDIETALASI